MLLLPDLNSNCSKTREEGHFVEKKGLRRVKEFFFLVFFFFDARCSLMRLDGRYIANEESSSTAWLVSRWHGWEHLFQRRLSL